MRWTIDRRRALVALGLGSVAGSAPAGQGGSVDPAERRLREDWAWLGRYAEDNRRLVAAGATVDVVFMGDSITEGWGEKRPGFFTPRRINRGISGQTTPQMLVRMMPDVVALRPRFVHIMAGTNDIAGNTGLMAQADSANMIAGMTAIARSHDIGVLLASVPPATSFPWRPGLKTVTAIQEMNAWLRSHARDTGATFVDYTAALATPEGGMRDGLAYDGVHPSEAGYQAMETVLQPMLAKREA